MSRRRKCRQGLAFDLANPERQRRGGRHPVADAPGSPGNRAEKARKWVGGKCPIPDQPWAEARFRCRLPRLEKKSANRANLGAEPAVWVV